MTALNPWQLLLWIAGLELISVPLIIFTANAIMIGYFKAKENHIAKMLNAFSGTIENITKTVFAKTSKEDNNEH